MKTETSIDSKSIVHLPPWEDPSIIKPGSFINTREFSKESIKFLKNGYYTKAPAGTMPYKEYWDEQYKRCKNGYTVGGVKITGRHYFYLNFCQIKATVKEGKLARKKLTFPRFLDMDFYYFHEVDKAIEEGQNLCIDKKRQCGFSYKNMSLCAYDFTFIPHSFSCIGAYEEKYALKTMRMVRTALNFIDEHSTWRKRKVPNTDTHIWARYKEKIEGGHVFKGYNSQVKTLTFQKDPGAARGDTFSMILWEEMGQWSNFLDCWNATQDTLSEGEISIGFSVFFGTGGEIDSSSSLGFQDVFYNPKHYNCRVYKNTYEEGPEKEAGLFIDDTWFKMPYVDEDGNSDRKAAYHANKRKRQQLNDSGDSRKIYGYISQHPLKPSESFLTMQGNFFPVQYIDDQINKIYQDPKLETIGQKGFFSWEIKGEGVQWHPSSEAHEVAYPTKDAQDKNGCWVIYEHPIKRQGVVPDNVYIAATDTYAQDQARWSDSLGSTLIMKTFYNINESYDIVVAEYTGRPEVMDEYFENVWKGLIYFNAICLFENMFNDMKTYFQHNHALYRLERQPDHIIKKTVHNITVDRMFGVHMSKPLKMDAINYGKKWLMKEKVPGNSSTKNVYNVYLINLLKELRAFTLEGNFDRVSAFLVLMLFLEDMHEKVADRAQEENFGIATHEFEWNELFNHLGNDGPEPIPEMVVDKKFTNEEKIEQQNNNLYF